MPSKRGSRRRKSITPKRGSGMKNYITPKKVMYSAISTLPRLQFLFYNRNYLYFISLFSIIYFLGNAINREYVSLITFMITSTYIYSTYSKNMVIVLTTSCISSIFITSIYFAVNAINTREGMTEENEENTPPVEDTEETSQDKPKTKENLTPLQPASFQKNKRGAGDFDVDLASTLEQSYGMLNNLLDNDGISNLTDETKRLINEQKKLFQSMNSMAPLIGQAKEMLGMFNTKDFKQMEGLAETTMKRLNNKKNGEAQQQPEEDDEL
jgi:hypothetical protein